MKPQVAPSLLSADFGNLRKDIEMINQSEADWLHLDIMDGVFVPNISFGFPVLKHVARLSRKPLDVHLMIVNPEKFIPEVKALGAEIMNVHYEACTHLHRVVQRIREAGMSPAVTVNPATPVSLLKDILPELYMVLVMGVNISPAFAQMLEKVPVLGQAVQVVTVRNWFSQQGNRQITVDQPGLSGDGASWAVNINEEIQQTVDRYLEEANQRLEEYKQAVLATGGSEEEFDSRHFQVSVDYEIQYQSDQYLSYVLYGRESWTGAGQITRFYNLDLTTGEVLTLEQLLGENWKELAEQAAGLLITARPQKDGRLLKVTENSYFNRHLRSGVLKLGFSKHIHCHLARHTFATTCLTLGIPLEVTSKLLGHRNVSTTMIYAKYVDKVLDTEMEKFRDLQK